MQSSRINLIPRDINDPAPGRGDAIHSAGFPRIDPQASAGTLNRLSIRAV